MKDTYNLNEMFFSNSQFKRITNRKYLAVIANRKIAVLLATKSSNYDSVALNKLEFENALRSKTAGKVDELYIVAAATNGVGPPVYLDAIDAEELSVKLAGEEPRSGRFGPFFSLTAGNGFPASIGDDEPF